MGKILLAEGIRFIGLADRFKAEGHKVFITNHVEGIEELMSANRFDLIVMEPILPCTGSIESGHYPGLDAFERIMAQRDHPPVIVATVYDKDIFTPKGAIYLIKPYPISQLVDLVNKVLTEKNYSPN